MLMENMNRYLQKLALNSPSIILGSKTLTVDKFLIEDELNSNLTIENNITNLFFIPSPSVL